MNSLGSFRPTVDGSRTSQMNPVQTRCTSRRSQTDVKSGVCRREEAPTPRWRGDGLEIYYLGSDNRMMAVDLMVERDQVTTGTPHALFQTRARGFWPSDVSKDGETFLVNTLVEEAALAPLTLISNWPALLGN